MAADVPTVAERALDVAGIGGWDFDVCAGRLTWTAVMFRIHEVDPAQQPPLETALDFYPPDSRPLIEAALQQGIDAGTPWDLELKFVTAGGRRLWVRCCGQAEREGDRTVRLFGAFEDITARRELAETAERLSVVAQRMTNSVVMTDRQGRTEWVNEAFTRQTGYTIEDMRGRRPSELLLGPESDPATVRHMVACYAAGIGYDVELVNYTRTGQPHWTAITCTALRDEADALTGYITVGTDVSLRRTAEGQARRAAAERERADALLRDVLDALPVSVIAYDRDERMLFVNSAYAEMFPIASRNAAPGRTLEEFIRRNVEAGQFPDAGSTPAEQEHWVETHLAMHRAPGPPRTLRLSDGRYMQARDRRSETGNLVCVRTDTTELKRAEELLRDVLDALPSAVTAYDRDERFILSNRAYDELFPAAARAAAPGRKREQVLRLAAANGQFADVGSTPAERDAWVARQLAHHRAPGGIRTLLLSDGRVMQAVDRRSESGNVVNVRTDTTELHRAESLLRDVLDAIPSAVIAYDAQERLTVWNVAATEMLSVAARFATPGIRLEDLLRLSVEHGQYPDAVLPPAEREQWLERQLAAYRAAGGARTVRLPAGRFAQARERRSENGRLVCVRTDTTGLMRAQAELRVQAERDALTGLVNRAGFLAALDRALAAAADETPVGGALLLLDIDYFKQINDTLGHDMGDALLVEIAGRLRALLRVDDIAARLGGDEFGVLIPGLTDARANAIRVDALHAALSAPTDLAGRHFPVGISAGVTLFPADGCNPAHLLKNADLALYEAKRNGRGRWSAFRPEQAETLHQHVRIADALRRAIARDALTVALQPKRRLRGGHAGFEALARWHDGGRWVPPAEFIPVAEDTGQIVALGRAVMQAALGRVRQIADQGCAPGRVAVNVTGPQLLDAHFRAETLAALRQHGLRPSDLELELTETVLFGRAAAPIEAELRSFSDLGVTLALDDFGTGYASLAHLSRLPIDRLKIDRSFVAGIGAGGPGGVIARSVVSLAHSLDMEVIAEGIETEEQLAFLDAAGCDAGQGYLFSPPLLTAAEAVAYLRGHSQSVVSLAEPALPG